MAKQTVKVVFDGKDNTGKAIKSLRGNLDNANKAIGKIKSSLGGMTGALGAAAGAAGFGLMAKKALETADNLAKTSTRLGIAAKDLGSLQLAANYAGVETGTFNKLMEIFQKRVGEAADGTGQAREVLEKFGISAEKLATLPLDQQLKIIADEFKGLENPAERAAAASDLFSNRGIKLLNFLDHGSEGLDDLRAEFGRLGLAIEDDALGNIESFNDSVTKFQGIVQAAMVKGLSEAAPQMEEVAQKLAEMAVPLTGSLLNGFQFLLDNIGIITKLFAGFIAVMAVTRVVQFATALIQLGKALATIRVAAIATQAALGPIGLAMAAISGAAVYFSDDIMDAVDSLDDMTGGSDDATDSTDDLEKALDELERTTRDVKRPLDKHADTVDDVADESIAAAVKTDDFTEALEKLKKASRSAEDEIDDFDKTISDYRKTVDKTEATQEDFRDALRKTITDLTGVKFEANDLRDEIDKVKKAIKAASDEFGENSEEVKILEDRLEDLGGELVKAIRKTGDLTDAQRDLLDEVKGVNPKLKELKEKLFDAGRLFEAGAVSAEEFRDYAERVGDEVDDLLKKDISGFGDNVDEAFDTRSVADFFEAIASGSGASGPLGQLAGRLIGSGGVQDAIEGCFGTKPVTDFDKAVRDLFGGSGSALGGFSVALGGLTSALGDFFSGGELKFDAFKDAIIRTLSEIAAAAVASVGINFLKKLIPGLATGGQVDGYAVGGRVSGPGGPKEDKVLARLSPGEYVINAATVSKFGAGFFDQINSGQMPGFALGGWVQKWLNGSFAYKPFGGYTVDNANWEPYLFDLLEALEQTDPRDDPGEAYDAAIEIVFSRIAKAVSDAAGMTGNRIGTDVFSSGVVGDMIGGILGPVAAMPEQALLNNFRKFNDDDLIDGLRDSLFRKMFGGASAVNVSPINFNMDEVVASLFNSAQGVAGGSLTLASREFGGPLERGQASVVGEAGPELFVPGRGGTVSPIAKDGGKELIEAVREVKGEVAALRRQIDRQQPQKIFGGAS